MEKLSELMIVTDDEKKRILGKHQLSEDLFERSVETLKEWAQKRIDFPKDVVSYDNLFRMALLNAKISIEKGKRCLEGYLTMKSELEDVFQEFARECDHQKIFKFSQNVIVPKLLPDLCRLQIAKIMDKDNEAEDGLDYYITAYLLADLRAHNDFCWSNEILVDCENQNVSTLMKFTPTVNYRLLRNLNLLKLRIHKIHIVNGSLVFEKIQYLMKLFLPEKLTSKVYFHQTHEDLHRHIPKEYLPSDYGGEEKSVADLSEMFEKKFLESREFFEKTIDVKIDTSQKQIQNLDGNDEMGVGIDGSFRKLEID